MPVLYKGQQLDKNDLNVYIQDTDGNYVSPFSITYTIFKKATNYSGKCCIEEQPLTETINTVPIPCGIGKFYAAWVMPQDIESGSYRIKWYIKQYADSPIVEKIEEFDIVVRSCLSAEASVGSDGSLSDGVIHTQFEGGCAG